MNDADYTEPSALAPGQRKRIPTSLEIPLVTISIVAGAAFLTKMCYLSLAVNTAFVLVFLTLFYFYVRARLKIEIPLVLLGLVFAALQVDALGNYFRMYGQKLGPMQYDEFAHLMVQVLISPIIVWLVGQALNRFGLSLPLKLTAVMAGALVFCLSAAYEIIELWDEIYFGGKRIWGPYDTATDLQWDLCGIIVGTLLSTIVLGRSRQRVFVS